MSVLTIALCGDVMTGRGIDQILPHPSNPRIHEGYAASALDYVALAERASGAIPRKTEWDYVWGEALDVLREARPDAFVVNLETAITESEEFVPKGINYRMHPKNAQCLTAAGIDCCVLANNHLLDWGERGLADTMNVLSAASVKTAGAGLTEDEAAAPAIIDRGAAGRILVYAFAAPSSGVPSTWAAGARRPGINVLEDLSEKRIASVAEKMRRVKRDSDVAIASIHWGSNWGYDIPERQRRFAHLLVDEAGIYIVHGHSSHHPKAAEIRKERPIFFGCGDFLNDYEGISGREDYRGELVLLYVLSIESSDGSLRSAELAPFRIEKFRLNRPAKSERDWLYRRLRREYQRFGLDLVERPEGRFSLSWPR